MDVLSREVWTLTHTIGFAGFISGLLAGGGIGYVWRMCREAVKASAKGRQEGQLHGEGLSVRLPILQDAED